MFLLRRASHIPRTLICLQTQKAAMSIDYPTQERDVQSMRRAYKDATEKFDVGDLSSLDPIKQFGVWFEDAVEKAKTTTMEPNAMAIATATKEGKPSVRMVLMKGFDDNGFSFFTNYDGRKALELAENSYASLLFYWDPLMRQVRIEGPVTRLSDEVSAEYFAKRPRKSQIAAHVSVKQSTVLTNRKVMEDRNDKLAEEFEGRDVPKPSHWGGYLVRPEVMEFWQGQSSRLHDRLVFRRPVPGEDAGAEGTIPAEKGWVLERLWP